MKQSGFKFQVKLLNLQHKEDLCNLLFSKSYFINRSKIALKKKKPPKLDFWRNFKKIAFCKHFSVG
jgi:hypothetical protein